MTQAQQAYLDRRDVVLQGGGAKKVEQQHAKGKLTARERMAYLFDGGEYVEYGMLAKHNITGFGMQSLDLPADGVVTGVGKVNGRTVYAYAQDFTVMGGSLGLRHGQKIVRLVEEACRVGAPLVGLNDSGGGRMVDNSNQYIYLFDANVEASGRIPQVAAIMGPCAGGAAYSPALMDFIVSVDKTSQMFITGPAAVKQATGEDIDAESLGGAKVHTSVTGVSHCLALDDRDCLDKIKQYLSYFPQSCMEKPPVYACEQSARDDIPELDDILPERITQSYDMRKILSLIADKDSVFEIQPDWAKNAVTALARLNGKSVGFVCNQPMVMAGAIDIDASDKMAHFINLCNSFNIPLIYLTDVPGYFPGVSQERGGIIRHGAKVLYANGTATVPKIHLSIRKVYGGASAAMCWSRGLKADATIAWPSAVTATMGAKQAVNSIFKKDLAKAADRDALEKKLCEEYDAFFTQFNTSETLMNDMIIMPHETRRVLIELLETYENKQYMLPLKKQGIMPV